MTQPSSPTHRWLPESTSLRSTLVAALMMVMVGVVARMMPHPPNFSPMASLAMFGGAFFASKRMAFLVPFAVLLITDCVLGFHAAMWATYGCYAVSVLLGQWVRNGQNATRIISAIVGGSVLFFLVTNLAVWPILYSFNLSGLIACYAAALPFFQNSLMGDVFFGTVFFGSAALASRPWASIGQRQRMVQRGLR